jgi:hypothetical protein
MSTKGRAAVEALFREELLKAGFDPEQVDVMSTGTGKERLFAVKVVLPEKHWAAASPALLTARGRAETEAHAPVGASFDTRALAILEGEQAKVRAILGVQ